MPNRRFQTTKQLLAAIYLLAVLLVIALLADDAREEPSSFTLSGASVSDAAGGQVLALHGERLHPQLKGLLVKQVINEKALLWSLLQGFPTRSIAVNDGLALLAYDGDKLASIALHQGQAPELLDVLVLPSPATAVAIAGSRAMVAMQRHAGLVLVDLQNPADLRVTASLPLTGLITSMQVDGDIVYFTDMYSGIGRVKLAAEPPEVELLADLESPWRASLQGSRLAVGSLTGSLHLFDITADGRLAAAGSYRFPKNIRGVVQVENLLYVALAEGTLYAYETGTWPRLNARQELTLPGRPFDLVRIPGQTGIAASLVAGGVALIDTRWPSPPGLTGLLKMPRTFISMALQDDKIWAATTDGLQVLALDGITAGEDALLTSAVLLDVQDYRLFSWAGRTYGYHDDRPVDFGAAGGGPKVPGRDLLAVAAADRVVLFARAADAAPEVVGSLQLASPASDARLQGDVLYLVTAQGLQVFDAGRPAQPLLLSELTLPGRGGALAALGTGYLLCSRVDSGLHVVDVTDTQRPALVATLAPPRHPLFSDSPRQVLVAGQRAFVAHGAKGVHVVDLSSPLNPRLVQVIDTPGFAGKMVVRDDLLMVADRNAGVFLIDIADSGQAVPIGSWPMPLVAEELALVEDGLIVSHFPGGTMKVPLPRRLGAFEAVSREEVRAALQGRGEDLAVYLYDRSGAEQVRFAVP